MVRGLARPQLLRFDAQCTIELTGTVLPANRRGQLHNLIVTVALLKAFKELVGHVQVGDRDAVGILQCNFLALLEQIAGGVIRNRQHLFFGEPQFAANGSVDILSEDATIQCRHSTIDQGRQFSVE